MSIDSAVWYIEAALNYTYYIQPINGEFTDIYNDSVFYNIEIQNNDLTYIETINIYNQLSNLIQENYNKLDYDTKRIGMIDIEYVNNQFKINIFIDYSKSLTKSTCTDCWNYYKNWYWGRDLGTKEGDCVGIDAGEVIYNYLRDDVIIPVENRIYMTNIVSIEYEYVNLNGFPYYSLFGANGLFLNKQLTTNTNYEPIIYANNMLHQIYLTKDIWDYLTIASYGYVPINKQYTGYCALNDWKSWSYDEYTYELINGEFHMENL